MGVRCMCVVFALKLTFPPISIQHNQCPCRCVPESAIQQQYHRSATPPRTDSTIAPPQNQRFRSANVSWLIDTRKGSVEKKKPPYVFFLTKDYYYYRTMTSGWQGAPHFRRYGRELVFVTGDFVKRKVGGATVVRLYASQQPRTVSTISSRLMPSLQRGVFHTHS